MYRKFELEHDEDEYDRCVAPKKGTELVFVTASTDQCSPRAGTTLSILLSVSQLESDMLVFPQFAKPLY